MFTLLLLLWLLPLPFNRLFAAGWPSCAILNIQLIPSSVSQFSHPELDPHTPTHVTNDCIQIIARTNSRLYHHYNYYFRSKGRTEVFQKQSANYNFDCYLVSIVDCVGFSHCRLKIGQQFIKSWVYARLEKSLTSSQIGGPQKINEQQPITVPILK